MGKSYGLRVALEAGEALCGIRLDFGGSFQGLLEQLLLPGGEASRAMRSRRQRQSTSRQPLETNRTD
jgi:hypothetical protein